ncbi:superfamily II DNA and RNA helicase [Paludibacter jiangxiensis]|uniref:Superfamily II DNA and RNA helicase n=2 Tax=Paludibacter jiangxiensis TaxID=681398 RepID=A0A171AH04_9BACT|nr:superfamily II DNA and RNA helicase [Paludibacter jiangxiensis]
MGIESLNAMQLATLDANETGKDIILLSPTGSGKTLAYLLPVLMNMNPECQKVQALIVAPSRELAQQIEQVWRSMGTGYKVNTCFGGRPSNGEKRDLAVPPALLIGTPGRIKDHIARGNVALDEIQLLVLDEFDKSLEMGFAEDMEAIIGNIPSLQKRILTSATDAVSIPAFTGIRNPIKLDYSEKDTALKGLEIFTVKGENNDKFDLLFRLLCYLGNDSTLVFCNQRETVEKVNAYLTTRHLANEFFHGKLEQTERERALSKFRNGSCSVFISTDLASRGLDIPEIKHVVHFDAPPRLEEFVHRNGRTARMEAEGSAYLLLAANEELPGFISVESSLLALPKLVPAPSKPDWATIYIGKGKKDKLSKMDVVGFMFKKGQLDKQELGLVEVKDYYSYVAVKAAKVKQVLRLVANEKIKNMKTKIELAE